MELAEYSASTIGYFSWSQSELLAELGLRYDREFRAAYLSRGSQTVDMELLTEIVRDSRHACTQLRIHMGHPDDL